MKMWGRLWRQTLSQLSVAQPKLKAAQNVVAVTKKPKVDQSVNLCVNTNYHLHNLEIGPAVGVTLTSAIAKSYLTDMYTIRRMEQEAAKLYREKVIRGFCHLYVGQEAVCVGCKAAMREMDEVITAYRCHGWTYMMGVRPLEILLELAGHEAGCMRGKGGSMHMYAPRFYGGNGIVGAHVPIGTGAALACKYKDNGGVVFAMYGDGAANQGQVFESYNMAALWKLPIIYCCENNHFGMGTAEDRAASNVEFYKRGNYIPGIRVDGMNIFAVRNAAEFAIEHALKNGPIILEFDTYRYFGHSMSDPGTSYRKREEIQTVRKNRDPISKFVQTCLATELLSEDECKAIDQQVREDVEEAAEATKIAKELSTKELTADVYLKCLEKNIRGTTGYNRKHFNTTQPFIK